MAGASCISRKSRDKRHFSTRNKSFDTSPTKMSDSDSSYSPSLQSSNPSSPENSPPKRMRDPLSEVRKAPPSIKKERAKKMSAVINKRRNRPSSSNDDATQVPASTETSTFKLSVATAVLDGKDCKVLECLCDLSSVDVPAKDAGITSSVESRPDLSDPSVATCAFGSFVYTDVFLEKDGKSMLDKECTSLCFDVTRYGETIMVMRFFKSADFTTPAVCSARQATQIAEKFLSAKLDKSFMDLVEEASTEKIDYNPFDPPKKRKVVKQKEDGTTVVEEVLEECEPIDDLTRGNLLCSKIFLESIDDDKVDKNLLFLGVAS